MATLTFECPNTRRPINSGIETDESTIGAVRPMQLRLRCSHCCRYHDLALHGGRLSEDWLPAASGPEDQSPWLSVAINSLRIFELNRGLDKAQT